MVLQAKVLAFMVIISTLVVGCGLRNATSPEASPTTEVIQLAIPSPAAAQVNQDTTPNPAVTTSQPSPGQLSEGLEGLGFDDFIEESYRRLLSRDPETVLELGLSQVYGTPTNQLTDISDETIHQTQIIESDTLRLLQQYDRATLTAEQQLTYDIYGWYLADRVMGQEFMYDDYPVNPTVFSVHLDLLQFFTDLRPVTNPQEVQDYITSLSQIETKFDQLIDGLKRREAKGAILPRFLVDYILGDLEQMATRGSSSTPYFMAFESKLGALGGMSESEKRILLSAAEKTITLSVLPAYQALADYLEHLQTVATYEAGVWKFPDGEAYYAYALRHYTSTDLTADQIHEMGLQALESIHGEMRVLFDQLGYPEDESIPELYNRVAADSGILTGEAIVQGYEDIITAANQDFEAAFDLRPSIGVIVVGVPMGGYYSPPAVDGSRPGMFYASNTGIQPKFSMPTLAYHEAIPGHHFQIAIAQQLDLPSFRRGAEFTAYVEGWALYAEHLVKELGFYDGDPYGDLGRLQAQAFRAARLVVDTGIHARRWSFDEAVDFMVENTGMPISMMQGQVSRYICLPGQATAYYIGYTKILEARQRAMDELGDQFDLKEFHNVLLGNGAMPLEMLDRVVARFIQQKTDGG